MRRGFTLIEVMLVVAFTGTITGAVCLWQFETQLAGAQREAQVQLQREASLVAETLGKAIRSANQVELGDNRVTVDDVIFELRDRRLWAGDRAVARHIEALEVDRTPEGPRTWRVRVVLGRFEAIRRPVRLERSFFVEVRR